MVRLPMTQVFHFVYKARYDKILVIEPVAEVLCEERTTTLLGDCYNPSPPTVAQINNVKNTERWSGVYC